MKAGRAQCAITWWGGVSTPHRADYSCEARCTMCMQPGSSDLQARRASCCGGLLAGDPGAQAYRQADRPAEGTARTHNKFC